MKGPRTGSRLVARVLWGRHIKRGDAMRRTRLHWMVLVAVSALTACSDSGTGNGGSGGAAGTGGTAGAGGIAGTGGAGGMGGMGGTAGTGGMGSPPEATIITPGTDSGTSNPDYAYDGFDSDLGLWYKDVMCGRQWCRSGRWGAQRRRSRLEDESDGDSTGSSRRRGEHHGAALLGRLLWCNARHHARGHGQQRTGDGVRAT